MTPSIDPLWFSAHSDSELGLCDNDTGPEPDGEPCGSTVARLSDGRYVCRGCYAGVWEEAVEALSFALSDLAWPSDDDVDDDICPDHGVHCHDHCTFGQPDPDESNGISAVVGRALIAAGYPYVDDEIHPDEPEEDPNVCPDCGSHRCSGCGPDPDEGTAQSYGVRGRA